MGWTTRTRVAIFLFVAKSTLSLRFTNLPNQYSPEATYAGRLITHRPLVLMLDWVALHFHRQTFSQMIFRNIGYFHVTCQYVNNYIPMLRKCSENVIDSNDIFMIIC
jgi:hypothetical protein